jgi:hypothetical protein
MGRTRFIAIFVPALGSEFRPDRFAVSAPDRCSSPSRAASSRHAVKSEAASFAFVRGFQRPVRSSAIFLLGARVFQSRPFSFAKDSAASCACWLRFEKEALQFRSTWDS